MATTTDLGWEDRPWGRFLTVWNDPDTTVKILEVHPGQSISLQYHEHRSEEWTLLDAGVTPTIIINGSHLTMRPGVRYSVPKLVIHRITNNSWSTPARVLEVSKGYFSETDIVRIHDKYGRAEPK